MPDEQDEELLEKSIGCSDMNNKVGPHPATIARLLGSETAEYQIAHAKKRQEAQLKKVAQTSLREDQKLAQKLAQKEERSENVGASTSHRYADRQNAAKINRASRSEDAIRGKQTKKIFSE